MNKSVANSPHSRHSSGVAMVAALGLMAVAAAVMVLLFMRTMDELQGRSVASMRREGIPWFDCNRAI